MGRDVDSIVRDLTEIGINMVKNEMSEQVQEKAAALAEERLLDLLLPPRPNAPGSTSPARSSRTHGTKTTAREAPPAAPGG